MRFFLSLILTVFSLAFLQGVSPSAFAFTGYLNPENLSLQVMSGDDFEYDVFFSADDESTFDVMLKGFRLDQEGEYQYFDIDSSFLTLEEEQVHLISGDEGYYYHVSGFVPADQSAGDFLYALSFQREAKEKERITLRLVHHLYLRVGEAPSQEGRIADVEIQSDEDDSSLLRSVSYRLYPSDDADQYFGHHGVLTFFDAAGKVLEVLEGDKARIVPPLTSRGFVYYRSDDDFLFPEAFDHAALQVMTEDGSVLYDEKIVLGAVKGFAGTPLNEAAFNESLQLTMGRRFVWTEWGVHFVLIILGLSLLAYALYPKRK